MRNIDLAGITKGKLTGKEMGEYFVKNFLNITVNGEENNPLSIKDIDKLIQNIHGEYNIKTYKKYYELLNFLVRQNINTDLYRTSAELLLWKISFHMLHIHMTDRPMETNELVSLLFWIQETDAILKQFIFLQTIFEMARELTGIKEIDYCIYDIPTKLIGAVNNVIESSGEDLPLIEYGIPPETVTKALEEIEDILDLCDIEKMRKLLEVPESITYSSHTPRKTVVFDTEKEGVIYSRNKL